MNYDKSLERNYDLLVAAAAAGERCPFSHPHGPVSSGAVSELVEAGRIRSDVYMHNYRVVTILTGEHAGKSTKAPGHSNPPYLVNGRHVERGRVSSVAGRMSPTSAPVTLARLSRDR